MEALIRQLQRSPSGDVAYFDREVSAKTLTLGSGADQIVQLLGGNVALEHARITASGGSLRIACRRGQRVRVNERDVRSAVLSENDSFLVGQHSLRVMRPPAGFDIALEVDSDAVSQAGVFESAFRTHLSQVIGSNRVLSWGLLLVVVTTGMALPLYYASRDSGDSIAEAGFRFDTRLWSAGDLIPPHQLAIGDDCATCHESFFVRVRDEQCTACHINIHDHVAEGTTLAEGMTGRCASCHRDHNQTEHVVLTEDVLCVDCHADAARMGAGESLSDVSGFDAESHPAFEASSYVPATGEIGGPTYDWTLQVGSVGELTEQSNLKFPHDVHLDSDRVQTNRGAALECSSCHTLSADREHFIPITMEEHCRSCHVLQFDESQPSRELPHGEPREVVFALEGYFARALTDPNSAINNRDRRRIPDDDDDDVTCAGDTFECATEMTEVAATDQFQQRGCFGCHAVVTREDLAIYDRFAVHPVRLTGDYFPSARFDHASHEVQGDASGDAACLTCHSADISAQSSDLLIPDIDTCTACHGDERIPNTITLNCVGCHAYHPADRQDQ